MKQSQVQRRAINAVLSVLAASTKVEGDPMDVGEELDQWLANLSDQLPSGELLTKMNVGVESKFGKKFATTELLHPLQFDKKDLACLSLMCMTGCEGGPVFVRSIVSIGEKDWFTKPQLVWSVGLGLYMDGVSVHPLLLQSMRFREWFDRYFSGLCPLVSDVTDGVAIAHVGNRPRESGGALKSGLEHLIRTAGMNEATQRHAKALLKELSKRQMT